MKVKELNYSITGVVPVASYQNLKPFFSMTVQVDEGDDPEAIFQKMQADLRLMFEAEVSRAKADHVQSLYDNIRFYELPNGKKLPSVTSILSWDTDWRITQDELRQYASRGTIVHKLIEKFIETGKWLDPLEMPELKNDVATVMSGDKKLKWDDCSYQKFFEKFGDKFEFHKLELEVHNETEAYAGRIDAIGKYEGVMSVIDFKSGTTRDMRQLAAYAVACEENIDQLVLCPVGETKTQQGFSKPVVCTDILKEFKEFKKARIEFKRRFGV